MSRSFDSSKVLAAIDTARAALSQQEWDVYMIDPHPGKILPLVAMHRGYVLSIRYDTRTDEFCFTSAPIIRDLPKFSTVDAAAAYVRMMADSLGVNRRTWFATATNRYRFRNSTNKP